MRMMTRIGARRPAAGWLAAATVTATALAGCGEEVPPPPTGEVTNTESSGLSLPPGFVVVDLPLEARREIFREAHDIRALAVQEANHRLPVDEAHLPKEKIAFEKRRDDHLAIIKEVEAKNLGALAAKHKIAIKDIERIEDEANRLRWIPPQEPTYEPPKSAAPATAPKT